MASKHTDFEGDWNDVDLNDGFWDTASEEHYVNATEENGWDRYEPDDIPSTDYSIKLNKSLRDVGVVFVIYFDDGDPGMGAYGKMYELPPKED